MNIVDFAHQVIEMDARIRGLEFENSRLRRFEHEYHELLNSSLAHNQAMMGNIAELCLTPGVIEACKQNKTMKPT